MIKHYYLVIFFTFNNIFFTFSNFQGNVIFSKTVGLNKLKGLKKTNQSTVRLTIKEILKLLQNKKSTFHIKFVGLNRFKKVILKLLQKNNGTNILSIYDKKLISYNGCKLKKKRRL